MTVKQQLDAPWEYHNMPGGMGGFAHKLMATWYHADTQNRFALSQGFPWLARGAAILYRIGHFSDYEEYRNVLFAEHPELEDALNVRR
jgi:hypothetical protein